jgi:hypothetical protein
MRLPFSSHTLPEIYRDLYLGESTGVLHLCRDDVEKRIFFDRGMILYAESPLPDEDLGNRLIREGKLSTGALAEARRNVAQSIELPQALVNRGLIGKQALRASIRSLVDSVVRTTFQWPGGTARFAETWPVHDVFEGDVVRTFEYLIHGIARMEGFEPIQDALKGTTSHIRLREPQPLPLERLALSASHGFILSRVDGRSTVRDLLSLLPPETEEPACRFVYGLLVLGILVYDPPLGEGPFRVTSLLRDHADSLVLETHQEKMIAQAYEEMRGKNAYELLGVTVEASRQDIERAYENIKDAFSRDRILPRVREKLRSELSVIESRLVEAYLTLTQIDQPRPEDIETRREEVRSDDMFVRLEVDKTPTKRRLEEAAEVAESYFQKARRYQREGDYHNAIQYGKLAVSYNSEDARYYFLIADCQVRNPEARWQRMAEQNYLKAAQLDPWNADYLVHLGQFYRRRGLVLRARKQFEQALKIAPHHEVAARELESLAPPA